MADGSYFDPRAMPDPNGVSVDPELAQPGAFLAPALPAPPEQPSGDTELEASLQALQPQAPVGPITLTNSSSTTQRTKGLDVGDARKDLAGLMQAKQAAAAAAGQQQAEAAKGTAKLLNQQAVLDAEIRDKLSTQREEHDRAARSVEKELFTLEKEVENHEIDGGRIFRGGSGIASAISFVLSATLGGFNQGLRGGPNVGLQALNRAIDRDIMLQRLAIKKKQGLIGGKRARLQLMEQRFGSKKAALVAESALLARDYQNKITALQQGVVAGSAQDVALTRAKEAAAQLALDKGLQLKQLEQDRVSTSTTVNKSQHMPTAAAGAPLKSASDKVREQMSGLSSLETALNQFESAVKGSSMAGRAAGKIGLGTGSLVNKAADQVRDAVAAAVQSGTLTDKDKAPYSFDTATSRNSTILEQIKMARKQLKSKRRSVVENYRDKYDMSKWSKSSPTGVTKR